MNLPSVTPNNTVPGAIQANAVLQAVRKDQTSDILVATKLTQFNNQRAHILVCHQRSYIADYDISGSTWDPIIRALNRIGYQGPLAIEWEDSGMDRDWGAPEALAMIRKQDFTASAVAFDAAFSKAR
jgi:hypothetical protein